MFIALLLITSAADEIPAIYKSSPYFSNAIGSGSLTVTASANTTTLALGESLTLTIFINHVRNPIEVKPPIIETNNFTIQFIGTRTYTTGSDIGFLYTLRPRTADVTEIPSIRFDYYFPEAAEDKRLRTKYTAAIPIVVKAKVEANATPSFTVPERFRDFVPNPPGSWQPSRMDWNYAPWPFICIAVVWILIWKHCNPQGARLAALKSHRAVRRALAAIDRDPVAGFRNYLRERFAFSPTLTGPSELSQELACRDFPAESVAFVERFLRDGDAGRYGGMPGEDFAKRAREAILMLEAAS